MSSNAPPFCPHCGGSLLEKRDRSTTGAEAVASFRRATELAKGLPTKRTGSGEFRLDLLDSDHPEEQKD